MNITSKILVSSLLKTFEGQPERREGICTPTKNSYNSFLHCKPLLITKISAWHWVRQQNLRHCSKKMFLPMNNKSMHTTLKSEWSMQPGIPQMNIFCRYNFVPKASSTKQRDWNYFTRNSCLKTVRFWVNLSRFFESKLRVTSAISLSKQRESRWCWSTDCNKMQGRCHQKAWHCRN